MAGKQAKSVIGKSTLQNEIVGYLDKEMGSLPQGVEDMKLGDLCSSLQVTFAGRLGQQSGSMINRMVSKVMTGGATVRSVRKVLERKWGLAEGRKDSVLLLATTLQPTARFTSEAESDNFIDRVVCQYLQANGIEPPSVANAAANGTTKDVTLDPTLLEHLQEDQNALNKKLIKVYATHLRHGSNISSVPDSNLKEIVDMLQSQLGFWVGEHGETYGDGVAAMFDAKKARMYDSSWNWGMQAVLSSFHAIIEGSLRMEDTDTMAEQVFRIRNQCNSKILQLMRYLQSKVEKSRPYRNQNYQTAALFLNDLIDICTQDLHHGPVARSISNITAPKTLLSDQGNIQYLEVPRFDELGSSSNSCASSSVGSISTSSSQNQLLAMINASAPISSWRVRIKRKGKGGWVYSEELTHDYWEALDFGITHGNTFQNKFCLITGASEGSIGLGILKGLLSGGASVVVTTRSYSAATAHFYQKLYVEHGARGSRLVVVPFNQGSKRDVESLISYIYDTSMGLGWDLDYIVPFAAISENSRDISCIDSLSELAHRIMLTNTIRILGEVKTQKSTRGIVTRPAHVILPLSPNHGIFGHDGLYAESKLALEALLNKWRSEGWRNYLSVCGAAIGWTRGTGLMSVNDVVAEGIEKLGVRTFAQQEMASNILGLMSTIMTSICQTEPIVADLMGGMDEVDGFEDAVSAIREELNTASEIHRAILQEQELDRQTISGGSGAMKSEILPARIDRRMNMSLGFPSQLDYADEIAPLHEDLAGMVDLERVVVVAGFAEIGPYGSSRTRWEMESQGEFSPEGCVEMAWMMGLIKHHQGPIDGRRHYAGWVDAKTKKPVADEDIKAKYESQILAHTGIRLVETSSDGSSDATQRPGTHELIVEEDLDAFEVSREIALQLKEQHGERAEIVEIEESDQFHVRIMKGATLLIPKATSIGRRVAGMIPDGWDARTYGISDDIISQVDKVTLYSLVCTVEALLSAGITDPYEFYQHIHTSDIGICIGAGVGGVASLSNMFKGRFLDKPVQNDILQETFINTTGAWVNMLLLSSNGPIRTPVGACATALESLDAGYDLIITGKAKMCLVGGFDDLNDDVAFEFSNMKATIDPETDFKRGRAPEEMSRPATTSRDGFVESHGCGLQILTSAKLALDMGLPIYGVVALTQTASDKIGRSVPAPGRGLLAVANEAATSIFPSPLLDIKYRRRLLARRLNQIREDEEFKLTLLQKQCLMSLFDIPTEVATEYMRERIACIHDEAQVQVKEAMYTYGNHFWKGDTRISPLRGSLATWGLTVDDVDVASFHGTSTVKGEKNELEVIDTQFSHLNRTKGNVAFGIFQKYLTGHPKGAAGAWMMNGCLQVLNSGLVPGNRNADNIDEAFEKFAHVTFPNTSIQTDGIKAFSVTSFGFGQKGAQSIGVHPKYLFATLDKDTYHKYQDRVLERKNKALASFQSGMVMNQLFVPKDQPPYSADRETAHLLDPTARFP